MREEKEEDRRDQNDAGERGPAVGPLRGDAGAGSEGWDENDEERERDEQRRRDDFAEPDRRRRQGSGEVEREAILRQLAADDRRAENHRQTEGERCGEDGRGDGEGLAERAAHVHRRRNDDRQQTKGHGGRKDETLFGDLAPRYYQRAIHRESPVSRLTWR